MPHKDLPVFELAILKGIIEHEDGTAYFGATGAYSHHFLGAVEKGWVEDTATGEKEKVTDLGRQEYERLGLAKLPQREGSRAYMWNWKDVEAILFPPAQPKRGRKKTT